MTANYREVANRGGNRLDILIEKEGKQICGDDKLADMIRNFGEKLMISQFGREVLDCLLDGDTCLYFAGVVVAAGKEGNQG